VTTSTAVYRTELPGLIRRGKVRDIYDLGDALMIVASDRISAFDVVMDQPVTGKGVVLTQLSRFWLETLPSCSPHHLQYVVDRDRVPSGYENHIDQLRGRAMVCTKADVIPVECVVRGYIVGGGWKEYQQTGRVSGVDLPAGLRLADRLPEPIFTPSTKADDGHDEPISFELACELAGGDAMRAARDRSLQIYKQAAAYAAERGIILADTKFEFGVRRAGTPAPPSGQMLLVDEVLTPDSSRFWPADRWNPGQNPPSFDKQFLRDYLETLDWNKQPPPPSLPERIVSQTRQRYLEAYRLICGRDLLSS
jgi:phosphoribosylaminoimidazole-succinocarboxamide synthase